MTAGNQMPAHAVGDYILQSDWMANEKTKSAAAAMAEMNRRLIAQYGRETLT